MDALEHLFQPVTIRGMTLASRAVMPPMGTNLANKDSSVSDALIAYMGRRAHAGAGLIIAEIASVHETGSLIDTELGIYDDRFIPGLARLAETMKSGGSKAGIQLHHGGRECFFLLNQNRALGPSAVPSLIYGIPPKEMTRDDLETIKEAFASAALRARCAGFDMVEIHAAHGYLLCQFLSPLANKRTDEYGGSSMTSRARYVVEVIRAVRKSVGDDYPISLRLSVDEAIKGGYTAQEMREVIPLFVDAGVDVIHASVGTYGSPAGITSAPVEFEPGFNVERARLVKSVTDVPVIAVGRFTDCRLAGEVIARGDADLVAFGRQFLADPDFLVKARQLRHEDIRTCIACNQGCIERLMFEGASVRCAINPETGQELIYPRERKATGKIVWVAGAGPAGLTSALEAARLGHRVSVFEKEKETGGQIAYASKPPFKSAYRAWIEWLERAARQMGADIRTAVELDEDMLAENRPDHVIVATGGSRLTPAIEGIDQPWVHDAWEILSERCTPGTDVLVIGAGLIGMETADFLCGKARSILIVDALQRPPVSKLTSHGYMLHKRLRDAGCKILLGAKVTRIEKGRVVVERGGKEETVEPVDQVIVATGLVPRDDLARVCSRLGIPFSIVGDAKSPRRIMEATEEGARSAWEI